MSSAHRLVTAALLGTALLSVSACASVGPYYPARTSPPDRRAYEIGFVEGREHGIDDGRSGRRFDYDRHREFRRADAGYRGYGDRNAYRALFREGFAAGYSEGYRRAGYAARGPAYGSPRGAGPAEHGYRDGFEQGRKDRRDGRRADPVRASRYRSADDDYDRRYGSRDDYKREYRAAFVQGYQAGYR